VLRDEGLTRFGRRGAVFVATVLLVAAMSPAPVRAVTRPARCSAAPRVLHDLRYDAIEGVDPSLLSLDLFLPPSASPGAKRCRPVPLVIGVHGGGWQGGDKAEFTGDQARLFNEHGWAFASVNYRLSGPEVTPPVRYPTHQDDVAHAVAYLLDHHKRYGIDRARVALSGHSAGAEIIAALATDEEVLERVGLGLDALRCAFPNDIAFDVADGVAAGGYLAVAYLQAFGDDPAVWAEASPINHIAPSKGIPPMLLTSRGEPGWEQWMEEFAARLRGAGVEVSVVDATGYTHDQVTQLIGSTTDPVMTTPVTDFFTRCFAPDRGA
jgi:acetyl esterase/lipase